MDFPPHAKTCGFQSKDLMNILTSLLSIVLILSMFIECGNDINGTDEEPASPAVLQRLIPTNGATILVT